MASSHKPEDSKESSKKAEGDSKLTVQAKEQSASTGDLSELLEQVEEMFKAFIASPDLVVSKDSESKKTQPWRSRRVLDFLKSGSSKNGAGSPWPPQQQAPRAQTPTGILPTPSTEWQETDDLYNCLRKILRNPMYKTGDRLSPEDDVNVRSVFQYHPKADEKTGPGIDYIKIDQIFDEDTRCFWAVRIDGTAVGFSYHKCLKAKAAGDCPAFLEHYDGRYMDFSRLDLKLAQRREVAKAE